ncbi:hypothetical protein DMH08_16945 [Actinomadura sp. WAC 06369]|nr:hypothetical protein DMH08_16945 [Actinomadura sp. WAC 06369]
MLPCHRLLGGVRRRPRARTRALLQRQPHAGGLRRPRPPCGRGQAESRGGRSLPLEETAAAHRALEAGGVRGKYVVEVA